MGPTDSVLVVENEEGRRQALERLLADSGYRVVAVEGDLETLSLAAELQPDSILLAASAGGLAEISRRSRQLHSLQLASAALTSDQELVDALQTVANELASLLEMKACAILEWDPADESLSLLAQSGPKAWWEDKWPAQAGDLSRLPTTAQVLAEGHVRQVVSQESGADPDELATMERHGITTVLKLPMAFRERVLGLVEVMDDGHGRSLAEEEITLARLLANQVASAIEDAHLYEVTRRYMVEATTLNSIGQLITSSLDLHQTLSIIADHAHWLLDVEAASVILRDEEGDALWFGAASGEGADFVRGQRLGKGLGIVNWVVQHGESLMVPDASQDPRWFGDWDKESGFTTRSVLCVPLRTKGQTIGAIEAINKASGVFDQKDQTLLTSIAASAAIAIENARLYEELRHRAGGLEETVARRTRELQAERDRTQAILEAVGEAVIVTDLRGRIQYLNPAAVALTGYTFEEAAGQNSRVWQQGQEPGGPFSPELAILGTIQTQGTEVVSRRKDGTLYDALMTVAPLFDSQEQGRLIGHVCVQRDITPIKEAERLKDQFVSNVSHELRTPLSIITLLGGNLDMLYDRLPDERRRKMIQDIREHAQVLDDLIGDILEISRIEGGRVSMDREPVYLMRLAMEEVEKQRPLAQKRAQVLQVTGAQRLTVWANREQLRLVVRNLLNNAIKYTPRLGQITCEGTILSGKDARADWPGSSALGGGRWAALRVIDTGIGISPEDLPRVYDRFFRVKSEGKVSGTGLGLSIAKELVEAHGGVIAAASTLNQGSTFAIYLPLQEE